MVSAVRVASQLAQRNHETHEKHERK